VLASTDLIQALEISFSRKTTGVWIQNQRRKLDNRNCLSVKLKQTDRFFGMQSAFVEANFNPTATKYLSFHPTTKISHRKKKRTVTFKKGFYRTQHRSIVNPHRLFKNCILLFN
jgi:hypothetical protein